MTHSNKQLFMFFKLYVHRDTHIISLATKEDICWGPFSHDPFCEAEGPWLTCFNQDGGGKGTPINLSCDWSTRFMKVFLPGLALVRIRHVMQYRCTGFLELCHENKNNYLGEIRWCQKILGGKKGQWAFQVSGKEIWNFYYYQDFNKSPLGALSQGELQQNARTKQHILFSLVKAKAEQ